MRWIVVVCSAVIVASGCARDGSISTEKDDTPAGCRNSFAADCGSFRWEPDAGPDGELKVEVRVSPDAPKAGETVTFRVTASDSDAQVSGEPASFEEGGPQVISDPWWVFEKCQTAFGPWNPPPKQSSRKDETFTHTYSKPGTHELTFRYFSGSYSPEKPPWKEPPGTDTGSCMDPYRSNGSAKVTVVVR